MTRSCVLLGYNDGEVRCADCRYDFSECEASGRCGDGEVTAAFEECDGDDFQGATCAGLGGRQGELACTADCLLDASRCERCGDGVLQPEAGETTEVDFESCVQDGYLGGVSTTSDCLTRETGHCGDIRFFIGPASVHTPRIHFDSSGQLWMSGVVQGAFGGFENPGCPAMERRSYTDTSHGEPIEHAYHAYATHCDDNFLGRVDETPDIKAVLQDDAQEPPLAFLDRGEDGWVLVRGDGVEGLNQRFVVEWISREGWLMDSLTVTASSTGAFSDLVAAGPNELALVITPPVLDEPFLELIRISTDPPQELGRATLSSVEHEQITYLKRWTANFRVAGFSAGSYLVAVRLEEPQEDHHDDTNASLFLIWLDATTSPATMQRVLSLGDYLAPLSLRRIAGSEDFELASVMSLDTYRGLLLGVVTPGGEYHQEARVDMSSEFAPSAVFRHPEGGWVVGGSGMTREPLEPGAVTCDPQTDAYSRHHRFAWRIDPTGAVVGRKHFTTPGFRYPTSEDTRTAREACNHEHLSYSFDGEALWVAGSWDRAYPLCSAQEPVPFLDNERLHACGIYLVRLLPELP